MRNSGLNFRNFPVTKGGVASRISGKEENLASYTQILRICLAFDFPPGISRIFVWLVRFLEIEFQIQAISVILYFPVPYNALCFPE